MDKRYIENGEYSYEVESVWGSFIVRKYKLCDGSLVNEIVIPYEVADAICSIMVDIPDEE